MKRYIPLASYMFVAACLTLFGKTLGSASDGKSQRLASDPPAAKRVVVQAAGRGNPYINFEDGIEMPASYEGAPEMQSLLKQNAAEPRALASADFDEDGVPDLICGYARPGGGIITLHRGNVDSIYQHSPGARRRKAEGTFTDSAFLSPARVFEAPIAADFVGAGDFDADGHWDVVIAARGSKELYLLPGDGKASFLSARKIALPGAVTSLITGEINRADGLTDVVVGVVADDGPKALIFEGPEGALKANPETFSLPGEPRALALGQFDDDYPADLAVGAGSELVIIHGRDRKLSYDETRRAEVLPARADRHSIGFEIRSIAAGDFTWAHAVSLAMLGPDGTVQVFTARSERRTGSEKNADGNRSDTQVLGKWPGATKLVCVRVSTGPADDLLVLNGESHQLQMLKSGISRSPSSEPWEALQVRTSVDIDREPLAVLPMRLNCDSLSDLVILRAGTITPAIAKTIAAATFTVNKLDDHDDGVCDAGDCTFREAINAANANSGADTIAFDIQGAGPHLIAPWMALPLLTDPVTIDGTTDPDFAGHPVVELKGGQLTIAGGNSIVRGLAINFGSSGITLSVAGHDIVEGNFIGTDTTGTDDRGNGFNGVDITNTGDNRIGGTTPQARNLISGNGSTVFADAIYMFGVNGTGNVVLGNFIGTDVTGFNRLENFGNGVVIGTDASLNTIGGTVPGARNVISGSSSTGVQMFNVNTTGNLVQGNFIGTNADGSAPIYNAVGVALFAPSNTVGGTTISSQNLISGNFVRGVLLRGDQTTTGNIIQRNLIGINMSGSPLPNGADGVLIETPGNLIGGAVSGASNTIAFNGFNGVYVDSEFTPTTGNVIRGNSIFSNGRLGIDLEPREFTDGVTLNDHCDGDVGTNNFQNFPVLTSAVTDGMTTRVEGILDSSPGSSFLIEFFANVANDPTGFGEGQTPIGLTQVTTGADCIANFNVTLPVSVAIGQFITATATDPAGNTSEFSACVQVSCGYGVSPSIAFFAMNGGAGSVNVFAASSACAWFAAATENWITIVSSDNGNGNGAVDFEVRENFTGSARQGNIKIADQLFTIVQDGGLGDDCQYSISPMFQSFPAQGGSGSVNVFAAERCAWQAVSNANWITITAGSVGIGNGSVSYSVAANPGASGRSTTINIGGHLFAVKQKGQ